MKVMEKILRDKFRRNRELFERLAATQSREIVHLATDKQEESLFWGLLNKTQG